MSLNRYERKKQINLCIRSFSEFLKKSPSHEKYQLVIAGGYDERIPENIEHHKELKKLTESLSISDKVIFKFSITNSERKELLSLAQALLYTPENEHFGIVPVEAMYMKCPVIACNTGGPKESIIHQETGFLLP